MASVDVACIGLRGIQQVRRTRSSSRTTGRTHGKVRAAKEYMCKKPNHCIEISLPPLKAKESVAPYRVEKNTKNVVRQACDETWNIQPLPPSLMKNIHAMFPSMGEKLSKLEEMSDAKASGNCRCLPPSLLASIHNMFLSQKPSSANGCIEIIDNKDDDRISIIQPLPLAALQKIHAMFPSRKNEITKFVEKSMPSCVTSSSLLPPSAHLEIYSRFREERVEKSVPSCVTSSSLLSPSAYLEIYSRFREERVEKRVPSCVTSSSLLSPSAHLEIYSRFREERVEKSVPSCVTSSSLLSPSAHLEIYSRFREERVEKRVPSCVTSSSLLPPSAHLEIYSRFR